MKNIFTRFVLVLFVLLIGLSSAYAERVSQEDAALVAGNFLSAGDTTSSQVAQAPARTGKIRRVAMAEEAQYYVYENANGEGWVMVAANDVAHPILAYSETGQFRTDQQPANLKSWLGHYNKEIEVAEQNGVEATEEIQSEWKALRKGVRKAKTVAVVSPLIETGWDQDSPYWNDCPTKNSQHAYVGCVATALAQVMNYWQWPETGTGSNSVEFNNTTYTVDFSTGNYDWANMLKVYGSSGTTTQKAAVAKLMYHCGVAVGMSYGTNGSGAYTINWGDENEACAENALWKYFRYKKSEIKSYYRNGYTGSVYSSWNEANWIAMLKTELDARRPIMYSGADSDEDNAGGHSFVCDGYDSDNKFHFNWGWENWCDGYYNINSLVTNDPGSGGGNGDYSYQQDVIIGIIPDKPSVTITWMANGSTFTTTTQSTGKLVLPTSSPADCSGSGGKKFVGWTTQSSISGGTKPSDLFSTVTTQTVTAATTYYAVYATESGSGGTPSSASYTFSSKAWAASPSNWTSGKDGNGFDTSKNGIQVTTGATDANGTCPTSYSNISSVVVSYCTNASKGKGTITVTVGSASVDQSITPVGTTATTKTFDFSGTTPTGTPQISVACTENSIYICGATINYGGGASYSDYSLTCGAACSQTPTMSFTNETVNKTTDDASYTQAVTISGKGSGQTVAYSSSDETVATVTNAGVVTLKGKVGSTTITASVEANGTYCAASASYTLNVSAAPINVTLYYNNTSTTINNQPNPYTLPNGSPYNAAMCDDDWTFDGWLGSTYAKSETKPTYITQLTATGSAYAVYKTTETSSGAPVRKATMGTSTVASVTFSDANSDGSTDKASSISDLVSSASGITSYNGTKVYAGTTGVKIGTGSATGSITLNLSSAANVKSVVVNAKKFGSDTGTLSVKAGSTDVGSAQSPPSSAGDLTFTASNAVSNTTTITVATSTKRAYIKSITIIAETSGSDPTPSTKTYYATSPDCATPPPATDYTVTWVACGETFDSKGYASGAALTMPASTPSDNAGKVFVGWTATKHYTGATAPADLFTSAGSKTVTADVTYYAVFH